MCRPILFLNFGSEVPLGPTVPDETLGINVVWIRLVPNDVADLNALALARDKGPALPRWWVTGGAEVPSARALFGSRGAFVSCCIRALPLHRNSNTSRVT